MSDAPAAAAAPEAPPVPQGPAEALGPPPRAGTNGLSRTPSERPHVAPGTPAAPAGPPAEAPREPSPAGRDADDRPSKAGGWLNRVLGRKESPSRTSEDGGRSDGPAPAADATTDPSAAPPVTGLPPNVQAAYDAVSKLSHEEQAALASRDGPFQRLAQGFVDKATARAQKQQADGARQLQLRQLAEQEQQLRNSDPYQAAELRNQLDAYAAQQTALSEIWRLHDGLSIEPALARLPDEVQQGLRQNVGPGVEGRKALMEAALDAYKTRCVAVTEKKLRDDPRFAKQVLARARGGYLPDVAPDDEPEVFTNGVGHARRRSPTDAMNAWLRHPPRGAGL